MNVARSRKRACESGTCPDVGATPHITEGVPRAASVRRGTRWPTHGGYQDPSESRILRELRRAGGRGRRGRVVVAATALRGVGVDAPRDHGLHRPCGDVLAPTRL